MLLKLNQYPLRKARDRAREEESKMKRKGEGEKGLQKRIRCH